MAAASLHCMLGFDSFASSLAVSDFEEKMATKSSQGMEDILRPILAIFSNDGKLKLKCHFRASKLLKFTPVGILLSV